MKTLVEGFITHRFGVALCVAMSLGLSFGLGFVLGKKSKGASMAGAEIAVDELCKIDVRSRKHDENKIASSHIGALEELREVQNPPVREIKEVPLPAPDVADPPVKIDEPPLSKDRMAEALAHALGGEEKPARYAVQVAALPEEAAARTLQSRLLAKGYAARVLASDVAGKGRMYRVRVGNFASRSDAERLLLAYESKEGTRAMVVME